MALYTYQTGYVHKTPRHNRPTQAACLSCIIKKSIKLETRKHIIADFISFAATGQVGKNRSLLIVDASRWYERFIAGMDECGTAAARSPLFNLPSVLICSQL